MKKLLSIFIISFFLLSCESGGDNKTTTPETPVEEPEKIYTVNPLPEAGFYYYTASSKIYRYYDSELSLYTMTANVSDGTTENITPAEFYKLGYYYFFIFIFNDEEHFYRQLYGEITEITESEMMRHPDYIRRQMDNGRFSITTNTWEAYTVSDIKNETLSSGICRTYMCIGYYIGARNITGTEYGLWFATYDEGLSIRTSGLYYWPENDQCVYKVLDEPGEMWY